MPVSQPERSSRLPFAIALVVIVLLGWLGLARANRERGPACDGTGRVLVSWPPPTVPAPLRADDLRERTFTVGEPGQKVRIDVRLGPTVWNFSLTHIFSVRVGTPADLVDEAVHPYDPPVVLTTGGTDGRAPRSPTGSAPRPSRPDGWRPRAIVSGDVIEMGSGNEDINEELELPAGTWYLATDDDDVVPSVPIVLRACGA